MTPPLPMIMAHLPLDLILILPCTLMIGALLSTLPPAHTLLSPRCLPLHHQRTTTTGESLAKRKGASLARRVARATPTAITTMMTTPPLPMIMAHQSLLMIG